jgi:hypothetical protein
MSDKVEFMLKHGTPDHIRKIVNNPRQHGIDNIEWAFNMALHNPAAPTDIVQRAYGCGVPSTRDLAAKHPNLK